MSKSGYRHGYSSDADQMRGLMDAAAAQAQGLDLSVGVALTPTQVAALTQDIIWLEEEEHMGRKVLVPHLYLASATQQDIAPGGGVQAKNVYINAGKSLLNEGRISGENVNLASVSIENTGGLLRGGSLNLTALNDIANNSGFIQGGDISLKAGGDIVSQTLTRPDAGNAAHQHVLAQGGIEATGTVTAVAGNDLAIRGSTLSAGGDVTLAAGRDMTVGTVTEEFHLDGGSRSWEHRVTHTGSNVAAGGNLNMTAGRDMTVAGSQVGAGGDAQLATGGNLSVVAVQDTFSSFVKAESGKGGLFSSSSKSTYTQDYRTSKSSTVASGGNLSLLAGVTGLTPGASAASGAPASTGHASVVGSNLVSGKDLTVAASGNVNVASAQNSSYFSHTKSTVGALGLSSSSKKEGNSSLTQVESNLIGQNITLDAGKSVSLTASNLVGSDNITVLARDGDVTIAGADNVRDSWHQSKSSRGGLFFGGGSVNFYEAKAKKSSNGSSANVGSTLMAGNDLHIVSSRDIAAQGSLLTAGNNVALDAGRDIHLLPGQDTSHSTQSSSKSSVGIGGSLGTQGISVNAGYNYAGKGNNQSQTENRGNLLSAGNDVLLTAKRDVNQVASHLEAGNDISVIAGRDWNMLAAPDTQNMSSWRKEVQAGLTISLKQNVTSAADAFTHIPGTTSDAKGGAGFTGISAAGAGLQAMSAAMSAALQTVSLSVDLGMSESSQKNDFHSTTTAPSSATAGRDIYALTGNNINIEGGKLIAGRDAALTAANDVNIIAAQNTWDQKFSSSSSSGGIGASIGFGATGWNVSGYASAYAGGAKAAGEAVSHTNALVMAGNNLSVSTGNDANVQGAFLAAENLRMEVGKNLNVASLQDTSSSVSSSWGVGGGLSFDISSFFPGEIGGLAVNSGNGADVTVSAGSGTFDSKWVQGQTAIIGSKEVTVNTGGNTDITGAVIASDSGKLTLNTDTLTYTDLFDYARGEQWSASLGGTTSLTGRKDLGDVTLSGNYASENTEQVDRATVGQGTVIVRSDPDATLDGLNRDTGKAQEVTEHEETAFSVFVSSSILRELTKGHDEVAEKHGFMANFLPGAGQNESNTGMEYYQTDEKLEFKEVDGERIPNEGVNYGASDQNPFLRFLYHWVPGVKSFSEIHDMEMKVVDGKYASPTDVPKWVPAATILPSFLNSFVHAGGSTLDVTNWSKNWDTYIRHSFEIRRINKNGGK